MIFILKALWFLATPGFANIAAAISGYIIPGFSTPVDFGKTFGGKRILGDHKTWRGIILGVIIGLLTFKLQKFLYVEYEFFRNISFYDYRESSLFLGFFLALGAIVGDLVKSFFKRRFGIKSGKSWFPFDQIDWIAGALLFSSFFVMPPLSLILSTLGLGTILHLISRALGYVVGVNKDMI